MNLRQWKRARGQRKIVGGPRALDNTFKGILARPARGHLHDLAYERALEVRLAELKGEKAIKAAA